MPETNAEMWAEKFRKNMARDSRDQTALREKGWNVVVLWECEIVAGTFSEKILPCGIL